MLYVTRSAKPDIIVHFSNSILLHFYNLKTQMYLPVKLQLRIPMKLQPYKVAAIERSICTVSIGKINYRCLLKWMQLTKGVMRRLDICTIVFAMNWGMDNWVSYSFYSPVSPRTKSKSMKKYQSRATASTSHEQTARTYNSFGALQSNRFSSSSCLGK